MKVWAISDLHLSFATPKPMDIFGQNWKNHPEKIAKSWRERVAPEDYVLCPGDISWAMTLQEAEKDLAFLHQLPGKKVLLRGNHDYWWKRKAVKEVRRALPDSLLVLQGDAIAPNSDLVFLGARGWRFPGERTIGDDAPAGTKAPHEEVNDEKITAREIDSMKRSIEAAQTLGTKGRFVIGMMHYPPFYQNGAPSEYCKLLTEAGVKLCIYGHLHGSDTKSAYQGLRGGIEYRLVSADAVDFQPVRLY